MRNVEVASVVISVITEAELLYGLVSRPSATRLHRVVRNFLDLAHCLPWTSGAAAAYAIVRNHLQSTGSSLSSMDTLIAAHAIAEEAVLVTHDMAFRRLGERLVIEDWTMERDVPL